MPIHSQKILILDFGSQYTQLIARRVREAKVYCEIHPYNVGMEFIKTFSPKAVILSGGPSSVYDKAAPMLKKEFFSLKVPVLGICYGMQLTSKILGGRVERSKKREYGPAYLDISDNSDLFSGLGAKRVKVWMSHGDRVEEAPEGFEIIARSENSSIAAIKDSGRRFFGVQFHPEVVHTPLGAKILENFIFKISGCKPSWTMGAFIESSIKEIKAKVGNHKVVCGISGGVDSCVTAAIVHKAIGSRLTCIFVDNGVLRKGEADKVYSCLKKNFRVNIKRLTHPRDSLRD